MKVLLTALLGLTVLPFCHAQKLYLGADLSYVNEVEDCGAQFYQDGKAVDPYALFAKEGANLIRVRLWHNPDWTNYSNLEDVVRTIKRSKAAGMEVLLDFHYSDTWADPGKQYIPAAWANIEDVETLGDSLYQYTYKTLAYLDKLGLLPEMVQVGNETNSEILQPEAEMNTDTIHWERNVKLLNRGIEAVNTIAKEKGKKIETMLHIAQPENAFSWFKEAFKQGIHDFDWIGLSYYPTWSTYSINQLSEAVDSLKTLYNKQIMVVETAYPYMLEDVDNANNILVEGALIPGYPATLKGQLEYMLELTRQTLKGGGAGVIYWEPAWVSSSCSTLWGQGSHWENATFFDALNNNEALPAFQFFNHDNYK